MEATSTIRLKENVFHVLLCKNRVGLALLEICSFINAMNCV